MLQCLMRSYVLAIASLSLVGAFAVTALRQKEPAPAPVVFNPKQDERVSAIANYTSWKQVTTKPVRITPELWHLCVPPTPAQRQALDDYNRKNPHSDGYIRVYPNDLARKPLLDGGDFPTGSILVKEKMVGPDEGLVARTVMRKHEPVWNPDTDGWEFYVVSKDRKLEDIASSTCVSCHSSKAQTGWVCRSYLGSSAP